jgi:hypothetical protein
MKHQCIVRENDKFPLIPFIKSFVETLKGGERLIRIVKEIQLPVSEETHGIIREETTMKCMHPSRVQRWIEVDDDNF